MFNTQFHHKHIKVSRERFTLPSMTEPDNAMSIPEIISRYLRGHGLAVPVLPESSDQAAREDGMAYQDDPDMFSEERQQMMAAQAAAASAAAAEPASSAPIEPAGT